MDPISIATMIWGFVKSPVGKWVAIAAAFGVALLVGKCALDNWKTSLREEGRSKYEQQQEKKQNETIRKGSDARRDAGSGSERDKRLRDKYRRD